MSDIEKKIVELVFHKLRTQAKVRAAALRREARGFYHFDKKRFHELKARANEFDTFHNLMEQLQDPNKIVYPATEFTGKESTK